MTSLVMSEAKKIENMFSTGAIKIIIVTCVVVMALVVGLQHNKEVDTLLYMIPIEMDDPSKSEA